MREAVPAKVNEQSCCVDQLCSFTCLLTVPTLNGPLEESLAGLAWRHTIVKTRGKVSTHQTQPFGPHSTHGCQVVPPQDGVHLQRENTWADVCSMVHHQQHQLTLKFNVWPSLTKKTFGFFRLWLAVLTVTQYQILSLLLLLNLCSVPTLKPGDQWTECSSNNTNTDTSDSMGWKARDIRDIRHLRWKRVSVRHREPQRGLRHHSAADTSAAGTRSWWGVWFWCSTEEAVGGGRGGGRAGEQEVLVWRAESKRGIQREGGTERRGVEEGGWRLSLISRGGNGGWGRGVQEAEEEEEEIDQLKLTQLQRWWRKGLWFKKKKCLSVSLTGSRLWAGGRVTAGIHHWMFCLLIQSIKSLSSWMWFLTWFTAFIDIDVLGFCCCCCCGNNQLHQKTQRVVAYVCAHGYIHIKMSVIHIHSVSVSRLWQASTSQCWQLLDLKKWQCVLGQGFSSFLKLVQFVEVHQVKCQSFSDDVISKLRSVSVKTWAWWGLVDPSSAQVTVMSKRIFTLNLDQPALIHLVETWFFFLLVPWLCSQSIS